MQVNAVPKLIEQEEAAGKCFVELEEQRLKLEEQIEERRQVSEQERGKYMQTMFKQHISINL